MSTMPTARDVVVFAGGDHSFPVRPTLPDAALVIAADSGLHLAQRLGVEVDHVVGDLDSVEPDALARARDAGVDVRVYPEDKDRTDFAIAVDLAMEHEPERIIVVGGAGGRLDHLAGVLTVIGAPGLRTTRIVAYMGPATVHVVHDEVVVTGRPGALVSLIPVNGAATGVTTSGLRFPLEHEDLPSGSSLGVSNEFARSRAVVRLDAGTLLVIQPGEPETLTTRTQE
ncbi:MAG: thiamine diphosphokinase [Nitriliruptoraceae bacterium]